MFLLARLHTARHRFMQASVGGLLALLGVTLSAAEGDIPPPRLPPTVQAAADKADTDIAKINAESAERIAKVRQGLIGALTKAQTDATKKGDLDLALYLKRAIQEQQALVATGAEERSAGSSPTTTAGGSGIKIVSDGKTEVWDNQGAYQMTAAPHQLSAYLKLPGPTKTLQLRAKPGYGNERIIWSVDGQGEGRMAREYTFTLKAPKDVVRLDGDHRGSNDAFPYGPLQYRLTPDGSWEDIPAAQLAPK